MRIVDYREVAGSSFAYRYRARLAVRGLQGSPRFGLFEEGTHRVVEIPECRVHHPAINAVAAWLARHAKESGIVPYNDVHHSGTLRYVQLSVERGSGAVQVVLVANSEHADSLQPLFHRLQRDPHRKLHSLVFNGQPQRSNAIFGPHWTLISGPGHLIDERAGVRVFYPPGAFSQANPELFDVLTDEIHEWVGPGAELVELYCGVGAIGLGLVPRATTVVFNEVSPSGLAGLRLGIESLQRACARLPPVRIAPGDAEAGLEHVTRRSTVIVDPPRKGLSPPLLTGLCERRPGRLIYVSCGFAALQRDAQELVKAGYAPRRLRAYALFPFTEHVEAVVEFTSEAPSAT